MTDGRKREIKSSIFWEKLGVASQTAEIAHQMVKIATNFEKSHLTHEIGADFRHSLSEWPQLK